MDFITTLVTTIALVMAKEGMMLNRLPRPKNNFKEGKIVPEERFI